MVGTRSTASLEMARKRSGTRWNASLPEHFPPARKPHPTAGRWLSLILLAGGLALFAGSTAHAAGSVVAWGDNSYGQTNVPVGLSNVVAIAGGGGQSLALMGERASSPWLLDPDQTGQEFNVALATERGKSYRLEFKNTLTDPNWTMLPPLPGDGTVRRLSDPWAGAGQRFHRVRQGQ